MSIPFEPLEYDASDFERIRREVGEHGVIMASLGDPLLFAAKLMSMADYLIWAATETEHFARTVATLHERNQINLRRMLSANVVDLYRICGPEYGHATLSAAGVVQAIRRPLCPRDGRAGA